MGTTWDQHREHSAAPREGALDDLAFVRRARNHSDTSVESIERFDALAELPGGPDHAHFHVVSLIAYTVSVTALR